MRYIDRLRKSYRKEYEIRRLRRDFSDAEDLVRELYKEIQEGTPVLVEGYKDVRAMRSCFGPGNYVLIYQRRTTLRARMQELVELFGRRHIVLTDLDKQGNALAKKIREILNELGAMAILKYRRLLSLFNVSFVESLESKAEEIRRMLRKIDVQLAERRRPE